MVKSLVKLVNVELYISDTCSDVKAVFHIANSSISTLSTGVWYHITVTLTTTETKIYIDGSLDITGSNTYSSIQNDQADLNIGRRGANADIRYFDGIIDEVGIWNTALTSTQVAEIYNGTGTNTTKDLTTVSGSSLIYWNRMGD